ncbi:MAG: glycerol-3-phosphate acyltransferase, partial [Myxococcales bacterium]|nr:glycerol-3-phosphate acyltransferase [Myxococcales bacterium]
AAAAATAAVVGHCFPVWLRLKGGKGVATTFGAVAAIDPIIALLLMVVWVAAVLLTHTPAIGSLIAATLLVVLPHVDHQPFEVHVFAVVSFVIILVRHRGNLKTLKARRQRARRRVLKRRKGQGAERAKKARGKGRRISRR